MFLIIWMTVVCTILFYNYGPHNRFKKHGVKYLAPVPLLGDMGRVIFRRLHWFDDMDRIYKLFPGERFIGVCEFTQPVIVIRDPDLIKIVTIRDFKHFNDHTLWIDPNIDTVFGRNLFALKGKDWKDMRSTLASLFTGSNLRLMMPFIEEAGDNMMTRLESTIKASGKTHLDIDIKDVTFRFAIDVYGGSAFGLTLDSQNNPAEFYDMANLTVQLGYKELLKYLGYQLTPYLMQKLKIALMPRQSREYFEKLLIKQFRERKMRNKNRPDMINLLLPYLKDNGDLNAPSFNAGFENGSDWGRNAADNVYSSKDLLAQVIGFLLGSTEAVASALAFLVHMLALHSDVQEKLVKEIHDASKAGKLDFDSIHRMTYLDMVVSEVLRLWSTTFMERVCTKDYNLGRPNDAATKDYIIRKGETIRIYMRSLILDPEYFSNPLRFEPERFSEKNRSKITPGTYSPFGMGPRVCIAYRFALTEIKFAICTLLRHMKITPCEKTSRDIQLSKNSINAVAKGGHWVRLQQII